MRHALLVGVPERDAEGHLDRVLGLEAMARLLGDLGGWSITACTGAHATRPRVLEALAAMVSACGPDDACLFYFFGHGGLVRLTGLRGELGRRAVFYLATLRPLGSRERVGVLDVELTDALARLDRACGNVTAIIDCCHAAGMVRDGPIPTVAAPSWVRALDEEDRAWAHAAEHHPEVVRLFGSSSLRSAFATQHDEGRHGLLTQRLVELVREAGLRCDRLTWDAVVHRAREWVSHRRGTEEQRLVLAGPRERLLFSRRTAPLPRTAAFVPAPTAGRGWIRAGLVQGVRVGDRWGLADLALDEALAPRWLADAEVHAVGLDSAEVIVTGAAEPPPLGAAAHVQRLDARWPVAVEGLPALADALSGSGLVQPVAGGAAGVVAQVRRAGGGAGAAALLDVLDEDDRPLWVGASADADGLRAVVELVEDRARVRQLEASLVAAGPPASRDIDLVWRWGILGPDEVPHVLPIVASQSAGTLPRIHAGDRLWVELDHRASTPRQWFASVLEIGLEGRPLLLNAHEPDGIEVLPGVASYVGLRGHRRCQALVYRWPARVPADGPRRARLLVLASHRPFSLGHLAREREPDDLAALAAQSLPEAEDATRSEGPRPFVTSTAWAWGTIGFEVDPRPRAG
jgi:hypothetical protein